MEVAIPLERPDPLLIARIGVDQYGDVQFAQIMQAHERGHLVRATHRRDGPSRVEGAKTCVLASLAQELQVQQVRRSPDLVAARPRGCPGTFGSRPAVLGSGASR